VAERVRAWGEEVLSAQGVSADRLVASAWSSLGYWYFSEGRYGDARHAFLRSIRERPSARAIVYGACCALPAPVTAALRSLKQRLVGTGGPT
jgi:hypothetical protein